MMVRILQAAAVEGGTPLYMVVILLKMTVPGLLPGWNTALDGRCWALQAGVHPHDPSFPPPGNITTCDRHCDATMLTPHPRHAVRPTAGVTP